MVKTLPIQHGEVWQVVDDNGKFNGQPAFSLKSLNKTEGSRGKKGHDSRWVLKKNDPDFEIVDELSDEELNMRPCSYGAGRNQRREILMETQKKLSR